MKRNGYGSFFVVAFNFRKSMQIMQIMVWNNSQQALQVLGGYSNSKDVERMLPKHFGCLNNTFKTSLTP